MKEFINIWWYGKMQIVNPKNFYYELNKRTDFELIEDTEGRYYEIYEHILSKKLYAVEV